MNADEVRRRLIWHGLLLFLLALLVGLVVPLLTNPRMGLSAHLIGLMGGMFLMLLGLIWREHSLGPRAASVAFWSALYGSYVNLVATLLAAYWGTGWLTPIAAAGYLARPWQEFLVGFGLITLSIAMVMSCALLLWGMRRGKAE
jgi:hydroxylaminobenzene mutase